MTEPISFLAVFAQNCDALKPKQEGHTRVWLDTWLSDIDEAKLKYLWRNSQRMRITIEVDPDKPQNETEARIEAKERELGIGASE